MCATQSVSHIGSRGVFKGHVVSWSCAKNVILQLYIQTPAPTVKCASFAVFEAKTKP